MRSERLILLLLLQAADLTQSSSSSSSPSWIACTNYHMETDTQSNYYDHASCHGFPRCGSELADAGFGADVGFAYHPTPGSDQSCQCSAASDDRYSTVAPMATYTAGQQVCLAYPAKTNVAETCETSDGRSSSHHRFVSDRGMRLFRSKLNAESDPPRHHWPVEYQHHNGVHEAGVVDYKGYQHCPKFCEDPENALCTVCFDLEANLMPGEYTFHWEWHADTGDDYYSTCWEARIEENLNDTSSNTATETKNDEEVEEVVVEDTRNLKQQVMPDEVQRAAFGMIDFSVDGGHILANGQPFHLKGTNWFGFEETDEMLHGLWGDMTMDFALDFLAENDFNALRVPYAVESLLRNPEISANSVHSEPTLAGQRMLDAMELLVNKAAERNILIMFDAHRLRAADGISNIWFDSQTTKDDAKNAWSMLADRFCDSWNVFAADLKNEPHGEAEWGTGSDNDWKLGAEELGNSVLANCPRWLVFVEGVERSVEGYDSAHGWWGGLLQGVENNPVELSDNSKLVYSPHVYGPSVFMKPIFEVSNFPNNLNDIWDSDFGFVPATTIHPIVIGEWGGFYEGMDETWQDHMMDYILQHEIGFFYWCLNPNSGDTGGLLKSDWSTPETAKLALLSSAPSTQISTLTSGGSGGGGGSSTEAPTEGPITEAPTEGPITEAPTEGSITEAPTELPMSEAPTEVPMSEAPTEVPITEAPTETPTDELPP